MLQADKTHIKIMPDKNKGTRKERRQLRRTKRATRQALLDNMAAQERGFYEAVDPVVYQYDNSRSYVTDEFGFSKYDTVGEHARDHVKKKKDSQRHLPRKLSFMTPKPNPYSGK